ncbi:HAD family hydrolase [Candidatus Thorarchaeota archaeon]|nr:MAG: HAD family hydrolase [Candidatus Thorarchaeota archaeon]
MSRLKWIILLAKSGITSMLKAIIFDLDGTITKLELPLEDMRRDTKNYYIRKGLPAKLLDAADGISSSTEKAKTYFEESGISSQEWSRMEREIDKILSSHEGGSAQEVTLMKDSLETVSKIKEMGFKTAILTNNGRAAVDIIAKQIPLHRYFDLIHTRHEVPNPKPFPDGLNKILRDLSVKPDESVYVGDALIDAVAANRAQIEFWGVTTGETSEGALREAGASEVFDRLSGIIDLARKRMN